MKSELRITAYDPHAEVAAYEQSLTAGAYGACTMFTGTMRSNNAGDPVRKMYLEHYPGMTEQQLAELVDQACVRRQLNDALLLHRVGEVLPGQTIVLIAAWSAHREPAFHACREILETLKTDVTLWKKEYTHEGERWVQSLPSTAIGAASMKTASVA